MSQMGPDVKSAEELNAITETVIGCAFKVGSALGPGYLEKVYENALVHELRKAGLSVEQQFRLEVWYDGVLVGEYFADVFVDRCVIVEVKATRALADGHFQQCLNYLTATRQPLGLVLNFGQRVTIKRVVSAVAPQFPARNPAHSTDPASAHAATSLCDDLGEV